MAQEFINAEYIARFYGKGSEKGSGTNWRTCCPGHGDKKPSMDVAEKNGKILLFCQVCGKGSNLALIEHCKKDGVWPIGGEIGNKLWTPAKNNYKTREDIWLDAYLVAQSFYDYKNRQGLFMYQIVRLWNELEQAKEFKQYYKSPDGYWRWSKVKDNVVYIPYNLDLVDKAEKQGKDIILVEGEKDCHTLLTLDQVASCNPMGALKWYDQYTPEFKNITKVYIIPDNDFNGYEHLNQVGKSFKKHGQRLYVIELNKVGCVEQKSDATDWIKGFAVTKELLDAVKEEANEWIEPIKNPWPDPKKQKFESVEAPSLEALSNDNVIQLPLHLEAGLYTDTGNGERFATAHSDEVKYAAGWGWVLWEGTRFIKDEKQQVRERAKEVAKNIVSEPSREVKRKLWWHQKSLGVERLTAMLKSAQSMPEIAVSVDQFNTDRFLLNCQNGVVNLRTGELYPHDRKFLCTQIMDCEVSAKRGDDGVLRIDFEATSERWTKFLNSVTGGSAQRIEFLQRTSGHWLTGDTSLQQAHFFYGEGQNGKSVFLDTMMNMMGVEDHGYATTVRAEMFMTKQFENHSDNPSKVAGKRFATVQEINASDRLDEAKLKTFTGDSDLLTGRVMRQDSFSFRNTCKIAFRCNHRVRVVGQDKGIWRRISEVSFEHLIPEEDRIPGFADLLVEDWPVILAWRIQGAIKVIADLEEKKREAKDIDPLRTPVEFKAATDEYKDEMDLTSFFLDECFEQYTDYAGKPMTMESPDKMSWRVSVQKLSSIYQKFCKDLGYSAKSYQRLRPELKKRGIIEDSDENKTRYFLGLRPKFTE